MASNWPEHEPQRGTVGVEDDELVEDEELWIDDDDDDHAGWFCVRTDPFPCPAAGCTFVADFMTAVHLVLVRARFSRVLPEEPPRTGARAL